MDRHVAEALVQVVEESRDAGELAAAGNVNRQLRVAPQPHEHIRLDILQIDPMAPGVRELAAPTIRAALSQAPELKRLVLERNRELNAAGYHAQVHVEDETSFFFLLEKQRRIALR